MVYRQYCVFPGILLHTVKSSFVLFWSKGMDRV